MKNLKKIISVTAAAAMVMSTVAPVSVFADDATFKIGGIVEECTSKSSIEKLSQKAALRFAQEVQKSGMRHYSREIEAAVKYIHLHLHVPVTLEETAEAAGISASYLSRLFKKETGMLFVDYIQKERIEAACNMLTYSDYTAAQISEYLCFSTQSYFIKIFRKYTGTTPAKYKKYKVQDWK